MHNPFRDNRRPPATPFPVQAFVIGAVLAFVLITMAVISAFGPKSPTVEPDDHVLRRDPSTASGKALPEEQPLQAASAKELARGFADTIDVDVRQEPKRLLALAEAVKAATSTTAARPLDALKNPAPLRGESLRATGHLVHISREKIDGADFWWGVVMADRVILHFYMADDPIGTVETYTYGGETFTRSRVEIEGVFLRLYRYEGKGAGPIQTAPVLFAKTLRVLPKPPENRSMHPLAIVFAAFGCVLTLILITAWIRSRKHAAASLRQQMLAIRTPVVPPSEREDILGDEVKGPPA